MDLLVVAKAPVPGRVKTRLCPPCSPEEAARLAGAALADTLDAALVAGADRVLLALDGRPGPWIPTGVTVVTQGHGRLGARLERAWSHVRGPGLQVGMDTPQVTAVELQRGLALVDTGGAPSALGRAVDGGWWGIALRRSTPGVFDGVPMSCPDTGERQHDRLVELGLPPVALPVHRDVDHVDDIAAVAALAPDSRFAAVADELSLLAVAR